MTDANRRSTEAQEASTGELIRQSAEQISRLVRDELALARAEMTEKGKRAGFGAGLFGGGGLLALYGVAALLTALVLGLAKAMSAWLAALIIGVVLLVAAGLLAVFGRKEVKQATPPVPEEAVRSVKADVDEVKGRAQR